MPLSLFIVAPCSPHFTRRGISSAVSWSFAGATRSKTPQPIIGAASSLWCQSVTLYISDRGSIVGFLQSLQLNYRMITTKALCKFAMLAWHAGNVSSEYHQFDPETPVWSGDTQSWTPHRILPVTWNPTDNPKLCKLVMVSADEYRAAPKSFLTTESAKKIPLHRPWATQNIL